MRPGATSWCCCVDPSTHRRVRVGAAATAELNGRVTDESGAVLPGCHRDRDADGHRIRADRRDRRRRQLPDLESADRSVPAGGVAAGLPHLRADRHRAAGRRDADGQRRARARLARGDGDGRSGGAARGRPQRRHQRGRRERADCRAAAAGPPGHRPDRARGRRGADRRRRAAAALPGGVRHLGRRRAARPASRTRSTARCTTTRRTT